MAPLGSSRFETISVAASGSNLRFVESVEPAHSNLTLQAKIAEEIGITQPPLQMDSQVKYGVVARGEAALYLRLPALASYVEKIWDHAAGSLIVEEAGGQVTDMYGRSLDFGQDHKLRRNQGIIVSRGDPLHAQVLTTISKI
jgi:3'(2'), 5'-bisphosphate nucleotidase